MPGNRLEAMDFHDLHRVAITRMKAMRVSLDTISCRVNATIQMLKDQSDQTNEAKTAEFCKEEGLNALFGSQESPHDEAQLCRICGNKEVLNN